MITNLILSAVLLALLALAGLFSGAETGIYQLSLLRLRLGIERRRLFSVILGKSLVDSSGLLLATLLGTNLAHYFITSLVTYLLLSKIAAAHTAELFATVITAPTLFVFSEMIPKNLFYYRADNLMPYCSPVLYALHKALTWTGVIALLKAVSSLAGRLAGVSERSRAKIEAMHASHLRTIVRDTHAEGVLSPVQTSIITRLTTISHTIVRAVMTPLHGVQMVHVGSNRTELLRKLKKSAFTRLPVYDGSPTNIIGVIDVYECLGSSAAFDDLQRFVQPVRTLPAQTPVSDAITIMQQEHRKIVLVTRAGHSGSKRPIGIVTMKDLVEELVGELTEW